VDHTPLLTVPRKIPKKISSMLERSALSGVFSLSRLHIARFQQKSKICGVAKASQQMGSS
jgi:hypothetical protein